MELNLKLDLQSTPSLFHRMGLKFELIDPQSDKLQAGQGQFPVALCPDVKGSYDTTRRPGHVQPLLCLQHRIKCCTS